MPFQAKRQTRELAPTQKVKPVLREERHHRRTEDILLKKRKAGFGRNKKQTRAGLKGREGKRKQRLVKESGVTELAALPAMRVRRIKIADIVVKDPRELNPTDVAAKAESMTTIGLKTPITVRKVDGQIELVAGEERFAAAKLLGWKEIDAAFFKGGRTPARIWHHLENLDHSDKFTPLEKAEKLAEVVELTDKLFSRQNVEKKRGRPIGVITRVLSNLSIKGKTVGARRRRVERALTISKLPPEVKAAVKAREPGMTDKMLSDIARQKTPETQLEKLDEIVKRKAKARPAKRNRVNKNKANLEGSEGKAPAKKHPDEVIYAELKSQCPATFRRTWKVAPTKVQRRFLREVLNWEGGKPIAPSP
jgi:ParB-like chromosome segregation protein Spo0J